MEDIQRELQRLKIERDAVILAHYYVDGSVQDIADHVGDSYYLSKMASRCPQKTIVLCGVRFMGESAKILNPEKTVLMPDLAADCPMAHMVSADKIAEIRNKYKDLAVVCYINSTADIKALSDVIVTSSNALKIVSSLPEKNIFFIPDRNLGHYLAGKLPGKNFILNDGYCHVHDHIVPDDVRSLQESHPSAEVLVHPECIPEVVELADYVGSTLGIIDHAAKSGARELIICTEEGVAHQIRKKCPEKTLYFPSPIPLCPNMKKVTVSKVLHVLETLENEIELDESVRTGALNALQKMHEIAM